MKGDPVDGEARERQLDVARDLLDRLVVDRAGIVIGRVDDVELSQDDDGTLAVVALLIGPQVWGRRVGHRLGRWVEGIARQLRAGHDPVRVPVADVEALDPSIVLRNRVDDIDGALLAERWFRDNLIRRIPGGTSASE